MIYKILLSLTTIVIVNSFMILPKKLTHVPLYSNKNIWDNLSYSMKEKARNWFIERAEKRGIGWNSYLEKYKDVQVIEELKENKEFLENKDIIYPDYYLKPFHGYDDGNMNWMAAMEGEGSTISMSVNYWKNAKPEESESWLRGNYTNSIKDYMLVEPKNIMDIGSAMGLGTKFIKDAYQDSNVYALDLSPYFVSVGRYLDKLYDRKIKFLHANAENIPFDDDHLDLVTSQYLFHEVPRNPSLNILKEVYRVLKPGGVISIIDLDPKRLLTGLEANVFRKWAFEVTEPHIYEYYNSNLSEMLENSGFVNIVSKPNDPINSVWFGTKPELSGCVKKIDYEENYILKDNYNFV